MKKNSIFLRKQKRISNFNQIALKLSDYKSVLINFANAKNRKKAQGVIIKGLQEWFNFKTPSLDEIESHQKKIRALFDELNNEENLLNSDLIHEFTFDYVPIRSEIIIVVQEDGVLGETDIHLINKPFRDILTHIVIKMFSEPKMVILLHKCENPKCNKYFLGKKQRPIKGPNRRKYCENPKCGRSCLEQRRVESGYHKKFKREKRKIADPKKTPGYFGILKDEI